MKKVLFTKEREMTSIVQYLLTANTTTPAYVVDIDKLRGTLERLQRVKKESGAKVLLATKAFALPAVFPIMREALDGTTASGLYEARLGREIFGKAVHVYSPAYDETEMRAIVQYADHVYFNSTRQLENFLPIVRKERGIRVGIRVNPGYSHTNIGGALYDPCAPFSRFGVTSDQLDKVPWREIHTLHVHALCESLHDGSIGLIRHIAHTFEPYVSRVCAVNFGGGHFIGKENYACEPLIEALREFRSRFEVEVILEPGAGIVVDAGYLVATVLDIHRNEKDIAILDTSASCHMPDVLEAPYRPPIIGARESGKLPYSYVLAGRTCMTGDIIGEYSFANLLKAGDRLVFGDMAQYSFVKNTSFNGTPLPDIATFSDEEGYRVVRRFNYDNFVNRLR